MSNIVNDLVTQIKKSEFYVPRGYQTLGGMWTVDTWVRDGIQVKVMDEGYTTVVQAEGLRVVTGYNGKEYTNYELGNEEVVSSFLNKLS